MLRRFSKSKLISMVDDRKRKISQAVLDTNAGTNAMTKSRTPDRVKRYKKLPTEITQLVKCVGLSSSSFQSARPLCMIKSGSEKSKKTPESAKIDKSRSSACSQAGNKQSISGFNAENSTSTSTSPLTDLILALDCEMVECISETGSRFSSLARCSIVGYHGEIISDMYVQQTRPVVDYRYRYSGISEKILRQKACVSYKEARNQVKKTIDGKLLVGHSIHNDFQVLDIGHPPSLTIDLASQSLRSMFKTLPNSTHKYGLKSLAYNHLHRVIQKGTHCSVEDSQASMDVFKCVEKLWLAQNNNIVSSLLTYRSESYLGDDFWPDDVDND